jgi:hypothetical protein
MRIACLAMILIVCNLIGSHGPAQAGAVNRWKVSYSLAESKWQGVFIAVPTLTPRELDWQGKKIVIKEAWIEYLRERAQAPSLVSKYVKTKQPVLCIRLSRESYDTVNASRGPFFRVAGRGSSFSSVGIVVMWTEIDSARFDELRILVSDSWSDEGAKIIKARSVPAR